MKDAAGAIRTADGEPAPAAAEVELVAGFLETSNVNAVGELTEIMTLARQFEIEVRLMRTAQENDQAASKLLQVG